MNVWLALTHEIHPHHKAARAWSETIPDDTVLFFCRITQLGLLRLLTNQSAMAEEALTQQQAWEVFDALLASPSNRMTDEPAGVDSHFRARTSSPEASTKQWADGYLAAFAEAAGLQLVTFDRALAGKTKNALLLG